jgi:hypothetical protein
LAWLAKALVFTAMGPRARASVSTGIDLRQLV